jgi:hypothetical protein
MAKTILKTEGIDDSFFKPAPFRYYCPKRESYKKLLRTLLRNVFSVIPWEVCLRAESSVAVGTYRFAVVILSSVQPIFRVHLKSAEFPSQSSVRTEEYLRIQLCRADNISDVRRCDGK